MAMKNAQWKAVMEELLDGVQRELGTPVPKLESFRARLNGSQVPRERREFEQELEVLLRSKPFLRAATERFLRKKARPVIEAAVSALDEAEAILAQCKSKKRRSLPN